MIKSLMKDVMSLFYGEGEYSEKEVKNFTIIFSIVVLIGVVISYYRFF